MGKLDHLSNEELVAQLRNACTDRRRSTVKILVFLAEVEARDIYLEVAASSVWDFCRRFLSMSHGTAYRFAKVASLCAKHPYLLEGIERGELHLTTLTQIEPFTKKTLDVEKLVRDTAGLRRDEVDRLLGERFGKLLPPASRVGMMPWDLELQGLIDVARELLSHAVPNGDVLELTKRAFRLLIADAQKKVLAKADRPRPPPTKPTKGISRHATRAMYARHGRQCSYVDPKTGARCPSRAYLQRDHIILRAHGGTDDDENLRPLCARHNVFLAKQALGPAYVERRIRRRRAETKAKAKKKPTVSSATRVAPRPKRTRRGNDEKPP